MCPGGKEGRTLSDNEQEQLAQFEHHKLSEFTELLPVGIMLLSTDFHILYRNRFFRNRFGGEGISYCYELLGKNNPCEGCIGCAALNKQVPQYWETTYRDGRTYGLHGFPVRLSDGNPAILIIGMDITERKDAERKLDAAHGQLAARAEQLRGLMIELSRTEDRERRAIAQVLHDDLQQLLVALKFNTEHLLRQIAEPEKQSELLRNIELISQSIQLTRSLTTELSPPILYESGLVDGLHWLSRRMKSTHGLDVVVEAESRPDHLSEDVRMMVFRSVRELLFNIVKHADTGEAKVALSQDSKMLHVKVEDKGRGFTLSERLETTPGSFGLFSIRERLSIMGGKMEIETGPGKGTQLNLYIPAEEHGRRADKKPAHMPEVVPQQVIDQPDLARVLVVDDHSVVREGLTEILEKQPGMTVVGEATNGQEAIERARELHPTTVLMDVTLPQMNGIEATRVITREMPDVRVIALSMHAREDMANHMKEAGADRYVLKDAPVGELITATMGVVNFSQLLAFGSFNELKNATTLARPDAALGLC